MSRPFLLSLLAAILLAGCEAARDDYDVADRRSGDVARGSYDYGGSAGYFGRSPGPYYGGRGSSSEGFRCRTNGERVRLDDDVVCDCDTQVCYRDDEIDEDETRYAFGRGASDRVDRIRRSYGTGEVFLRERDVVCVLRDRVCLKDGRPDREETSAFFGGSDEDRYREGSPDWQRNRRGPGWGRNAAARAERDDRARRGAERAAEGVAGRGASDRDGSPKPDGNRDPSPVGGRDKPPPKADEPPSDRVREREPGPERKPGQEGVAGGRGERRDQGGVGRDNPPERNDRPERVREREPSPPNRIDLPPERGGNRDSSRGQERNENREPRRNQEQQQRRPERSESREPPRREERREPDPQRERQQEGGGNNKPPSGRGEDCARQKGGCN